MSAQLALELTEGHHGCQLNLLHVQPQPSGGSSRTHRSSSRGSTCMMASIELKLDVANAVSVALGAVEDRPKTLRAMEAKSLE